jgi:predicted acyl esterase
MGGRSDRQRAVADHTEGGGTVRHDIEFPGFAGTRLRGWLYVPETELPVPGVVMAHGFSALKEMAMDRFAEIFCEAGLTVLAYDHRNLGASDGEPRQEINPWAQARDYRYAIGWLAERGPRLATTATRSVGWPSGPRWTPGESGSGAAASAGER